MKLNDPEYKKWLASFGDAISKALTTPEVLVRVINPDPKKGWPMPMVDGMVLTLEATSKFDSKKTDENITAGKLLFELTNGSAIELID